MGRCEADGRTTPVDFSLPVINSGSYGEMSKEDGCNGTVSCQLGGGEWYWQVAETAPMGARSIAA